MVQAAKAALAAARQSIMQTEAGEEPAAPAAPLPAFGSGIEFRPRSSAAGHTPATSGMEGMADAGRACSVSSGALFFGFFSLAFQTFLWARRRTP